MARVTFKNPVTAIRGKIGGLIFRQMRDGTIIVSRAPDSSKQRKSSKAQRNQRQNFRTASVYGDETAHLHPVYEELAKARSLTAYNIALSDKMMPPVIHRILVRDGKILIEASDNVMVAMVEVMILDEQGNTVEKGKGTRVEGDWWEYVPERAGKTITAAAWDLAGNVTTANL